MQAESMEAAVEARLENPITPSTTKGVQLEKNEAEEKELGHESPDKRRITDSSITEAVTTSSSESSGRERLKRHHGEVAGRVRIPEMWGQEDFLKDWIDSTVFDAAVRNAGIMSARAALVAEGRRATTAGLRIQNSC